MPTAQGRSAYEMTALGMLFEAGSPLTYSERDLEVTVSGAVRGSKEKDDSRDIRKQKEMVSFGRTSAQGESLAIDSGEGGKLRGSTFHAKLAADTCFS